jgi:hydroxymethylpyrimidine/phosphomethylpyrimidine kinase
MKSPEQIPIALTIAGSDSGGGAGIQADLKTFAALGVHGTSAITSITAQNPRAVTGIQAVTPAMVRKQIEAIFAELPPRAAKTGMLFSAPIIRVVAGFFREHREVPLVVDPVMIATSGARLLAPAAEKALRDELLPLATLITPNLDEAAALTGHAAREPEDLRRIAELLRDRHGCAVLVKGGHLRDTAEAIDIFRDDETELLLNAPFVRGVSTHGTGCTYSAAITAFLARGLRLPDAVAQAKQFITGAIQFSQKAGKHFVLTHAWKR